jgi:hypothetical protein
VSVELAGAKRGRERTVSSTEPSAMAGVWSFSSRARRRIANLSAIGEATVPIRVRVRSAPGGRVPRSIPAGWTRASPSTPA